MYPCNSNPCQNATDCVNDADLQDYVCTCEHGFVGKNCELPFACDLSPCENSAVCVNSDDYLEFECVCGEGYNGLN